MSAPARSCLVMIPDRKDFTLEGPGAVEVRRLPLDAETWSGLEDVEFLVAAPWFGRERIGRAMERMPSLKVVQTFTAGVDWILPVMPAGVTLCDARGPHDVGVAEWSVAMLLALARGFPELRDDQREGRWHAPPKEPHATYRDLHGSTLLVLGHGSIGRAVEERLAPFGVELIRVGRTPRDGVHAVEDLPELLPRADAVLVLLPLTSETKGMVDDAFLARMKPGAALVNAARGEVADTDAIVRALQEGRIRAGLDVMTPEPLPPDHPLWSAPGAFVTPHIGGRSPALYARLRTFIEAQVERYVRGEALENVVENEY